MDIDKIPLNRYEFFAMIVPGSILLGAIIILVPTPVLSDLGSTITAFEGLSTVFQLLLGLLGAITIFLLGVINSAITKVITRIPIKMLGYPSKHFLVNNNDTCWEKHHPLKFYKESLDESIQRRIKDNLKTLTGKDDLSDAERYFTIQAYVRDNCQTTFQEQGKWSALYHMHGALFVEILVIWGIYITAGIGCYNGWWVLSLNSWNFPSVVWIIIIVLSIIVGIVFFLYYLYYMRICDEELFRSFAIANPTSSSKKDGKDDERISP